MKYTVVTFLALSVFMCPAITLAADDGFGAGEEKFSNQGHPAFGEPTLADEVSAIEPASGEEEELEEVMGDEVTTTVIDHGDGDVSTRDRVGEGDVGIFYQNDRDDRIMDDDDAIGVEMKLLEFQ
ncbi:MAG: hypothetical protein H6868_02275 [Rhodospirillales bacterium]|nr:hypothetical protein [Rhodospirillales bacterium]